MFQFYNQLEVTEQPITGKMITKDVLVNVNLDGMSFNQFVLYLKDIGVRLVDGL